MPRLITADVTVDSSFTGAVHVRFATTRALMAAADTAVLTISDRSGSEFGIRLERGRVTDVHLWDVERLLRQGLPTQNVVISEGTIRCDIPKEVLPRLAGTLELSAALVVNGALVQSGFPVTIATAHRPTAPRPRVANHALVDNHATEGQIHG